MKHSYKQTTIIKLNFQNFVFEHVFKILLKKWIKKDFTPNNYRYFLNIDSIKDLDNFGYQYVKSLNKSKLEILKHYQGNVYYNINRCLRGYLEKNKVLNKYIEKIEQILGEVTLKENIVVIRRVEAWIIKGYKKQSYFVEKGFLSTSINLSYRLDSESTYKLLDNEALLMLKIPARTNALYVEEVPEKEKRRGEYELLVQKGSVIKFEKIYRIFSNKIVLGTLVQN